MIKVFIIDDHEMFIEGLILNIGLNPEIETIGQALNGEDGIRLVSELQPDVVLLDINMEGINGIDTCKLLIKAHPKLKIIGISMHKETRLIKTMLNSGAMGYVLKNASQKELVEAIKTVYSGETFLAESVKILILESLTNKEKNQILSSPFPSLSRREKEVLALILDEHTTQEMADKLFISFGTIETHRKNMLSKTGARNTAGLVRIAIEYNLLADD